MPKSTLAAKPSKPYKTFPLYPHASGRWAKKIKGKNHYFGKWSDDWQVVLTRYEDSASDIQNDRPIRTRLTLADLCNRYLAYQDDRVTNGELAQRTFNDAKKSCVRMLAYFGRLVDVTQMVSDDFAGYRKHLAKGWSLKTLDGELGRIKAILNYATDADLVIMPIRTANALEKPSKANLTKEKQSKTAKYFTNGEIEILFKAADGQMKCFMLLALNGGLGNADIGRLEHRHLVGDRLIYPRGKTGISRTIPLWFETQAALAEQRSGHERLVFLTCRGNPWYTGITADPLSAEFGKLCDACLIQRNGRGFYALRHVFRTLADSSLDPVAYDRIMGHKTPGMGQHYNEYFDFARLVAVVDHVRKQLVLPC